MLDEIFKKETGFEIPVSNLDESDDAEEDSID